MNVARLARGALPDIPKPAEILGRPPPASHGFRVNSV